MMADRQKVIKGLECCKPAWFTVKNCADECCPYNCYGHNEIAGCVDHLIDDALALLKEQEPKTPIHIHEEYTEHDWETDEAGNIDDFAMECGYHYGPACKRCGYSFCEHCNPNGWNAKPCVVDYYQCPKCGKRMCKDFENIVYCEKCGQAVKWDD